MTAPPDAAVASAPRVRPTALILRVTKLLDQAAQDAERAGMAAGPVLLFRTAPVWDGEPDVKLNGRTVRVVGCVSALAVMEQLALHMESATGGRQPSYSALVLLTDRDESELGPGVLSHVFRHNLLTVDLWAVVEDGFGVQRVDTRLVEREKWAAEALIDAMPARGWPPLSGSVLTRDTALRVLAAKRLNLEKLGLGPDDLDASALLRWSADDGLVHAFTLLRASERQGLEGWLGEQAGRAATALFALVEAGHGSDALPLGLVCGALWAKGVSSPRVQRARGRVDTCFGDAHPDDRTVETFAATAEDVVRSLLTSAGPRRAARPEGGEQHRRDPLEILDRAEELLVQLGAEDAARHSGILRSAFEHRVGVVAAALRDCLDDPGPEPRAALAAAVEELAAHQLSNLTSRRFYADRMEQVRMAQRLVRWLDQPPGEPRTVGEGINRHLSVWGWVDLALDYVWAGDATHSRLQAAYRALYDRVRERRRAVDESFARQLAAWTAGGSVAGSAPGQGMLLVESILERVVAPLTGDDGRAALLVVLDGMSAAVAVELAEELRVERWEEYDPLAGDHPDNIRRRAAVAVLPAVTRVSRMSLLAGELRTGDQNAERAELEGHPRWRGRKVRLFHQAAARGGPGAQLSEELDASLSEPDTLVAVVLNTVDDALDHGRERAGPGWRVEDAGLLGTLLDHARHYGRAVILTSDHGHVPERGGELREVPDAISARHRGGAGPLSDGEVELTGSRVLSSGNRIVALWDPDLRYLPRRAGYHGGASPAEVTVPLLAFLPLGAGAPDRWRALADQRPSWWTPRPTQVVEAPPSPPRRKRKPAAAPASQQEALDLGVPAAAPAPTGTGELLDTLMASETFRAQHGLTPRKVPEHKIRKALGALLDAGGVLPLTVVADRAGEHPGRARGFIATLRLITNVDNYPVLSEEDNGRTVRLNEPLLREQFGIGESK